MNNQLAIIVLLVILVVLVAVNIWLYRHYRRNIKKVTFLFDAIDNGDFSFNFPTEKRFKEDKILHQSLNRIKLFLQHTREEQMDREKYYEQILNAVDTGILVVDSHDNILQHNQAALRLLDTDVLTHMNQVKGKLKDEHLAKHETQAMLKDKHVRIIALSDVSHELSNQEVDSWIKLIRVLTHEIMNTITPVTSLSETLLTRVTEDKDLKQGLETIHKTGTELLAFVNNYRRFTHVPQPQPALFYVEPFLERMALLCNHEVEIEVSPKNAALNELRDCKRRKTRHEKMMEGMPVAEIMHEDEQTEIDVLYFAINQLPPERRRIFMMVYAEGKKYKEVAEHLQISINTVRTQLSRSLKFLREKLEGHMFTILLLYFRKSE